MTLARQAGAERRPARYPHAQHGRPHRRSPHPDGDGEPSAHADDLRFGRVRLRCTARRSERLLAQGCPGRAAGWCRTQRGRGRRTHRPLHHAAAHCPIRPGGPARPGRSPAARRIDSARARRLASGRSGAFQRRDRDRARRRGIHCQDACRPHSHEARPARPGPSRRPGLRERVSSCPTRPELRPADTPPRVRQFSRLQNTENADEAPSPWAVASGPGVVSTSPYSPRAMPSPVFHALASARPPMSPALSVTVTPS